MTSTRSAALRKVGRHRATPARVAALYAARAEAIASAHAAGVSQSEIARRLGVGRKVVRDVLRKGER